MPEKARDGRKPRSGLLCEMEGARSRGKDGVSALCTKKYLKLIHVCAHLFFALCYYNRRNPPNTLYSFCYTHKNEIPSPKKASLPRWPFYFSVCRAEKEEDVLFFLCNV